MRWVKTLVPDDFDPELHKIAVDIQGNLTECDVWKPQYRDVLDHGFLGLVDFMGDDQSVVNAARVSYGSGTKRVSEDTGLIRYLIRNKHWSPVEMVEIMWHVKAPIFVFRQWHRHRAASINEYSGRYSVMSEDMYMPAAELLKPQSKTNKQGREGELSETNAYAVQLQLEHVYKEAALAYGYLLGQTATPSPSLTHRLNFIEQFAIDRIKWLESSNPDWAPDKVTEEMVEAKMQEIIAANGLAFTDEEYWGPDGSGLSRELSRICLPVATYSEMYWKSDLRNTFNFISLRSDPHAQHEIKVYSDLMLEMLKPIAPVCVAAFIEYQMQGRQFSAMEYNVVKVLYQAYTEKGTDADEMISKFMSYRGASKREIKEFIEALKREGI